MTHPNFVGKKGRSGRKSKKFEFEIAELKELSLKRAIKILKQKDLDDEKLNRVLNSDKQEITLKVIDKALSQEVNVTGEVKGDFVLKIEIENENPTPSLSGNRISKYIEV